MRTWRGRRCRAALASTRRVAGIGLVGVVLAVPGIASAGEERIGDTRDVGTRLDLKALTHGADGASIVHTAETYAPFSDQSAVFKWGIDRDGDEAFDLIVFTEWRDGKLSGGVKDAAGQLIAPAAVSRPGPAAIRVAFPAEVLGGAPVYRYAVDAEGGPGDRDLAPNAGLIPHRVAALTAASADAEETRTAASAPAKVEAPAPAKVEAAAPATNLPRTGPGDRALLPWAGAALMLGGGLVALGAQRNRIRRRARGSGGVPRKDSTGGIR